ncbi:GNAT family N-acetyltransferase [Streptomyces koyangensis]|uniref:GNAT family N-acetyltransferase n=1 Tax=Streptomyces koyangensis TaxID=188770 RepID=A0A385DDW9_9ACTN|nr:GNAT family N-acetyltransferase [Streptomyces koyangensis]AXQ56180.1 GNAT family N-acetyltransferase [Streptomyces koyangensis]
MIVRPALSSDVPGLEHWFGPMVDEPGFHQALDEHVREERALVAVADGGSLVGGLLFGSAPPVHHVHWVVVSERARGTGVGRALMAEAVQRYVRGPGTLEVVTFGADHPGAVTSGARAFYTSLGFSPAEQAPAGPEGGSRQVYRKVLAGG